MSRYYRENQRFDIPEYQEIERNGPVEMRGRTIQSDRDAADINKIIARFEKGQNVVRMNGREPFYGDVSDLDGLADAKMKILAADELFMSYNADIRERFDNDPVKLVEFLGDERTRNEAIELGLIDRPVEAPASPPPAPVPEQGR